MIYQHQQDAIRYIADTLRRDDQADALLISGSIQHGFNDEKSDIDVNIVVPNEVYEQKRAKRALTYWEGAEDFYPGGYFDGKYITLDYLSLVAERGNEPTRFALHDSRVAFDKTGKVSEVIQRIGAYPLEGLQEKAIRFLSQLEAWKWYCDEALRRDDRYLLDFAALKLILYAGRLILLENRTFFPYHKWFMRVLERCEKKPSGLMAATLRLLEEKTAENITALYELVKNYRNWAGGVEYSWPSNFVYDVETVWMRQDEFIENL